MLIYSRWRPDIGGFEYFQSGDQHNINDDLPTPEKMPATTKIGVPSMVAGRPLPPGARKIGTGPNARGLVTPVDEARIVRRIRSLSGVETGSSMRWLFVAGAAGLVVWLVVKK